MRKKFTFVKNLILAVASALTLIAVSFAWFSDSNQNFVPSITGEVVSPTYANVIFFSEGTDGSYSRLVGDMALDNWTAGSYQKYRIVMTTATDEALKIGMTIDGLPSNMNADLKNSVQVKYTVYKATKVIKNNVVTFEDGAMIFGSDYMRLSELSDGKIFEGRSLEAYQTAKNDVFVIYYELGLAEDSPSTIEGLSS